jgi:Ran-binding protein 9/10
MGFGPKTAALTRPVGWENDSFGYHGDDGNVYIGNQNAKHYGPGYTTNDIVGCGINFLNKTIFFTRNGVNLGEQTWGKNTNYLQRPVGLHIFTIRPGCQGL